MKKILANPEQKETVRHGEHIFPVQKYESVIDDGNPIITAHWHEESELTMIKKGSCRYHINMEDIIVEKGDILFLSPMLLHSASKLETTKGMKSDTFVFHLNFLGGNSTDICSIKYLTPLLNQRMVLPYIIRKTHPAYRRLKETFVELAQLYSEKDEGYELMMKALLMQFLFEMMKYKHVGGIQTENGVHTGIEKIKRVLIYIDDHYDEQMTIKELAASCYFSEYHFMRAFKQCVGMTCIEYINNLRLEKAVEFLEQGNRSILEVSLSAGFHNLSYFHRAFRKKYNATPGEFLKKLK